MKSLFNTLSVILVGITLVACTGGDNTQAKPPKTKPYTRFVDFTLLQNTTKDGALPPHTIVVHEESEDASHIHFSLPQDALSHGLIPMQFSPNIITSNNESVYIGDTQILLNTESNQTIDFTQSQNLQLKIIPFGESASQESIYTIYFESAFSSDILFNIDNVSKTPSGLGIVHNGTKAGGYNRYFGDIGNKEFIESIDGGYSFDLYPMFIKSNPDMDIDVQLPMHFIFNNALHSMGLYQRPIQVTSADGLVNYTDNNTDFVTSVALLKMGPNSTEIASFKIKDAESQVESYAITGTQITIYTKKGVNQVTGIPLIYSLGDDSKLKLNDKPYNSQTPVTFNVGSTDNNVEVTSSDGSKTQVYPINVLENTN